MSDPGQHPDGAWGPPTGPPGPPPSGYGQPPYGPPPQGPAQPPQVQGQWGPAATPWATPAGSAYPGMQSADPFVPRAEIAGGLVTALVLVVIGAPLGLLWEKLSPAPDYAGILSGRESSYRSFFSVDLVFAAIFAVVGLLAALAVRRPLRRAGVGVPVGLVVGGLVGSLIAARTGPLVHPTSHLARDIGASLVKAGLMPFNSYSADDQASILSFAREHGAGAFQLHTVTFVCIAPAVSLVVVLVMRYLDARRPAAPVVSSGSILPGQAPAPASR